MILLTELPFNNLGTACTIGVPSRTSPFEFYSEIMCLFAEIQLKSRRKYTSVQHEKQEEIHKRTACKAGGNTRAYSMQSTDTRAYSMHISADT